MAAYEFLSPEWTEEARKIQEEFSDRPLVTGVAMRMNLVVNEVPFGDGTLDAHLDTSEGQLVLDTGHLEEPDLTVTLDYGTAKAILVDQDPQAGMQAFMAGRIKVQGDMAKLLALQAAPADPAHVEVAARVKAITK